MIRISSIQRKGHVGRYPAWLAWQLSSMLGMMLVVQVIHAGVTIDQLPLTSVASVPGNLVFTPSVEHPTINRAAYVDAYSSGNTYIGYFDSEKCYAYHFDSIEANRYFYPVGKSSSHKCVNPAGATTEEKQLLWSGNYLNWATTQAVDAFRKGLTGGYRVKDTVTETWLEKARNDGRIEEKDIFPLKRLPARNDDASAVYGQAPFGQTDAGGVLPSVSKLQSRVHSSGNQIEFYLNGDIGAQDMVMNSSTKFNVKSYQSIPYNPSEHGNHKLKAGTYYTLSVRVKVCVPGMLEGNCVQYGNNYKPEGLIQRYSDRLRFSVFGYLNDHNELRDGAALRANQKYVGPKMYDPKKHPKSPWIDNPAAEWDSVTGVYKKNPDDAEAKTTSSLVGQEISDSGLINYLNKFGQMTPRAHKYVDPVSEMYYAARRYLKNQGGVAAYTNLKTISERPGKPRDATSAEKYQMADGFPVITDWKDPYQFWCQPSVILGIGDTNTFSDKNLPGNPSDKRATEPPVPDEVKNDSTINVLTATTQVMMLEFQDDEVIKDKLSGGSEWKPAEERAIPEFNGLRNSAYIAGLAYDNHTVDLRNDVKGRQTASTYWVDVRQGGANVQSRYKNQYWLAAKYGAFSVPQSYSPYGRTEKLPEDWWTTNGESIKNTDRDVFDKRPDAFFSADNAQAMIESLEKSFKQITETLPRTGAALSANASKLTTGTMVYQTRYDLGKMTGDIEGYKLEANGAVGTSPTWQAATKLDGMLWSSRKIYFNSGAGYGLFTYDNLTAAQKGLFGSQNKVDYVRGKRDDEGKVYRVRSSVLGTLVNSAPLVVLPPGAGQYKGLTFSGADKYDAFVSSQSARKAMLYVGGNDGMLHAFDSNSGDEKFAFIPNAALALLPAYSNVGYVHKYMVDGTLAVKDVYTSSGWKTVLVGSMGFGGRSVFALDVTNPDDIKLLWEKTSADVPAIGNNLGAPVVTQVANGDWRVLLGNGPNSDGDKAQLIMIGVGDGVVTTVDTGVSGDNGLSGVGVLDSNGDGIAETAYAGDLKGNLWRFGKLFDTAPMVSRLFQAKDASGSGQPITAAPLVGVRKSSSETWVWFGTGRMLSSKDLSDSSIQTWYGLVDDGTEIGNRSILSAISGIKDYAYNEKYSIRTFPTASGLTKTQRGWYVDLPVAGERMIYKNDILGSVLVGASRIPDATDPCAPTGKGFIMFINAYTGGRLSGSFVDINQDGKFDDGDKIDMNGAKVPISGIGTDTSSYQPVVVNQLGINTVGGDMDFFKIFSPVQVFRRVSWREIRRP